MVEPQRGRQVIEINQHVIGPRPPRLKTVRPRKLSDYPHVSDVYRDVACRLASPLRMGPPICDELMALVQHLLSEEEAGVARHLGLYSGRSALQLARAEHRPVEQIQPILDRLSEEKRIIVCSGPRRKRGRNRWASPARRLLLPRWEIIGIDCCRLCPASSR